METKTCELCEMEFDKPTTCSAKDWLKRRFCSPRCKKASQVGSKPWNVGLKFPDCPKQFVPCRICGQPTKYRGSETSPLNGKVHCEQPECIEKSRQLKNQSISTRHRRDYETGAKINGWKNVSLVSKEEVSLMPWFESLGWIAQFKILTGVHTNKLPRYFKADFADAANLFYIEIDGHVHRLHVTSDARRDSMLSALGWKGLRVPASLIKNNPEAAKAQMLQWIQSHETAPLKK